MLAVSAFVLVLVASPVLAQRGGGGHSGGSAHSSGGGFSSGHSFGSHSFGSQSFSGGTASHGSGFSSRASGSRSIGRTGSASPYAARPSARAYSTSPGFSSRPYASSRGYGQYNRNGAGVRVRTYGYGRYGYGYGRGFWGYGGYGYPWYFGYYDPYWFWDSGSSDDSGAQYWGPQYGYEDGMDDQGPPPPYDDAPDTYARSAPAARSQTSSVLPPTVLVFRDRHKEEVQNYAIIGQTLWNFAPQRTEKIPLYELDIPATTKANEDRGVDFQVPVTQGKLSIEIQSDSIN